MSLLHQMHYGFDLWGQQVLTSHRRGATTRTAGGQLDRWHCVSTSCTTVGRALPRGADRLRPALDG